MRIFIDVNIVLDVLLKRESFFENSAKVMATCKTKKSALAPHTISNIFFITRKEYTPKERKTILLEILEYMDIVPTGKHQITQALKNDEIDDFEDALQIECAKEFNADYIVTRNLPDFSDSGIEALSPTDFIKKFEE